MKKRFFSPFERLNEKIFRKSLNINELRLKSAEICSKTPFSWLFKIYFLAIFFENVRFITYKNVIFDLVKSRPD